MITLITGASSSGKSNLAENIAVIMAQLNKSSLYYIATMHLYGEESEKRVKRHRDMRANKGFLTIEKYVDISDVKIDENSVCLLECMSNLLANEMYDKNSSGNSATQKITFDIKMLEKKCRYLIIVTNEIFSDGIHYDDFCTEYIKSLGFINQNIATISDVFVESVVGIPIYHKGSDLL